MTSLTETIAMMHSVNLVHGDLSLSNVLALQGDLSHLRDEVYLIDLDDAFLDDGEAVLPAVWRKSKGAYDPYSVACGQVSKETDVFVLGLWIVAFMQSRFHSPDIMATRRAGDVAGRLKSLNSMLPGLVDAALGPLGSRPSAVDLYKAVRSGAGKIGALG
ncbi:MAG: hypothetical protein KDA37_14835 [Planctomycetales bacterium]|nr:hypothetical protein [Planctomycetales bacterium]